MSKKSMKLHFLIIDPQNDFCSRKGTLFVGDPLNPKPNSAETDAVRLGACLKRLKNKIDDIHVTLDEHHPVDIAHPIMWKDSKGNKPNPFTMISYEDVLNGVWVPFDPSLIPMALNYTKKLKDNGRYVLVIWPPHCLIGTWGACVVDPVFESLREWEEGKFAIVDYVTKGSNYTTEHYSAVQADVPDPKDPGSMLQTGPGSLIHTLQEADLIALSGQALDYCVANTVRDIANNFGEDNIKKLVLLTDTTSPVGLDPTLGPNFIAEMAQRGMQLSTSVDFLS